MKAFLCGWRSAAASSVLHRFIAPCPAAQGALGRSAKSITGSTPIVNTIALRYKDRGLAVIGVNTSDEDGLAAHYVRKKGLNFPIVYDEGNAIAKQYRVANLPTLIVVSKTGKIVAIRHGVTSDAALDDIVRRYL